MSRKGVESTAEWLRSKGVSATAYHAGLPDEESARAQDAFARDEMDVVVATVAFGMGINKSNVRFVVHRDMPDSVEAWYQEIARDLDEKISPCGDSCDICRGPGIEALVAAAGPARRARGHAGEEMGPWLQQEVEPARRGFPPASSSAMPSQADGGGRVEEPLSPARPVGSRPRQAARYGERFLDLLSQH